MDLSYPRIVKRLNMNRFVGGFFSAAVDVLVVAPCVYFPVYYGVDTFLHGGNVSDFTQKLKSNILSDSQSSATIWIPIHGFNFSLVPPQNRSIVAATCGYGNLG